MNNNALIDKTISLLSWTLLVTLTACGPVVPEGYLRVSVTGSVRAPGAPSPSPLMDQLMLPGAAENSLLAQSCQVRLAVSAEVAPGTVLVQPSSLVEITASKDVATAFAGNTIVSSLLTSIDVPKGKDRRIVVWGVADACNGVPIEKTPAPLVGPLPAKMTYAIYGMAEFADLTGSQFIAFDAYAAGPLANYGANNTGLTGRFVNLVLTTSISGLRIAIFDIGANHYLTASPSGISEAEWQDAGLNPLINWDNASGNIRPLQPNRNYRFEFYSASGQLVQSHCYKTAYYPAANTGPYTETATFSGTTECE